MPPKKQQSSKADVKAKTKKAEDLTFGLKNKNKSAKVGKYVQQVQQQVMTAGNRKVQDEKEKAKQALAEKKATEEKKKQELAELFKPVLVQQKVPFGVDPKTVLCQFFKQGACQKGDKCKFSHDLSIERKTQKKDLYSDTRDEKQNDTMDTWDQEKLEQVVLSKHGNPRTITDIVCKYFLEAIENGKYGWFWECPNGGDKCKYRHALPPGYVLKSKQKKEDKEEISIEEFLETERHKLGPNLTPVTLESFQEWKRTRKQKQDEEDAERRKNKEQDFKAGRSTGMSGKDLFEFNPDLANESGDEDDGDVFDLTGYKKESDDENDELERVNVEDGIQALDVNDQEEEAVELEMTVQEDLFAEEQFDDSDKDDDG